jgi:hypothetical protein
MLSNGFEFLGARSFPLFGRAGVLTSLPVIEQAQQSTKFVDQKNRTLANGARMRHPKLEITRGLAFAHPQN